MVRAGFDTRFACFDGLRALAVIGVAYSHWMPERFLFGVPWGRLGVQLFFVLSGFLITTILLRELEALSKPDRAARWTLVRGFVIRRALRIFPIYWLTLSVALLVGSPEIRADFWWHFFYASNVLFAVKGEWAGPASHLWTLSVEEQFYLLWPLLIVFSGLVWRFRAVAGIVAICAVVSMGLAVREDGVFLSLLPVPAFLGIASGALLALVRHENGLPESISHPGAVVASGGLLAIVLGVAASSQEWALLGTSMTSICIVVFATCVIAWASVPRAGFVAAFLTWKPLVFLGTISYGFYLYHNFATPIFAYGIREGWLPESINWGLQAPLSRFAFTLALASASWFLIERPLGRVRARIPYSRSAVGPNPVR